MNSDISLSNTSYVSTCNGTPFSAMSPKAVLLSGFLKSSCDLVPGISYIDPSEPMISKPGTAGGFLYVQE